MRALVLAVVAFAVRRVSAQDVSATVPACAAQCFTPAAVDSICEIGDVRCFCGYLQDMLDCLPTYCTSQTDIQTAGAYFTATCVNLGVTALPSGASQTPLPVAATGSQASVMSISSELAAQQGKGGSGPDVVSTVMVLPSDPRIKYDPASSWKDTSSESGVGTCTNGTKATTDADAKLSFVFQGTDISLFIIPSSHGGSYTVQIDGDPASTLSSSKNGSTAGSVDQCISTPAFSKTNMEDKPHQIIVKNGGGIQGSSAGTLEFNGLTYKGAGAFGTTTNMKSKPSTALIGSTVGVIVGIVVSAGAAISVWLYKRKKRRQSNGSRPSSPTQPMMLQQMSGTPYSQSIQMQYSASSIFTQTPPPLTNATRVPDGYANTPPGLDGPGAYIPPRDSSLSYADQTRPVSSANAEGARPVSMWMERAHTSSRDQEEDSWERSLNNQRSTVGSTVTPTPVYDPHPWASGR